ncbi:acid protease [Roridomyces roridus]|uniref:Acid protease n=1 Tax=Roridomyces roridus TaxID=1738132 RepID=A0AAD7CJ33_9AGAR|nr:acid protease [Roridomyces roridus]
MLFAFYTLSILSLAWGRHVLSPITIPIHVLPRVESSKASSSAPASTISAKVPAASGVSAEASAPEPVSGITPVSISSDRQTYYALLKIGPVDLRVALDTGSSDLWITGSTCTTRTCAAVPRYPLNYASATFGVVNDNQTVFSAQYADGTAVSGFVAREAVQMANLTVPDLAFGVVTNSNLTMLDDVSGILGLGFPRLSTIPSSVVNATPFFPSLAQQGVLDYPLFGLSLTNNESGSLSLGAIDSSVVANVSKIGWNKVVEFSPLVGANGNSSSYLHWVTPLAGFAVNGSGVSPLPSYPKVTGNSSLAMFDVGNSGIYGPYQDVERLFQQINGARLVDDDSGQWAIPCDTVVPLSFTFGQQNYTLQPEDYFIGPAAGNPEVCLTWPRALPPTPDGIDWHFGVPFLRTVYSVFSYGIDSKEAPRIGFYALNNASQIVEASDVSAFLSSVKATVATTLPNSLLSTPTFPTPSYSFNASVHAPTGGILSSALATNTYSAIFGQKDNVIVTNLPLISPGPTTTAILVTNAEGIVSTSFENIPTPTLGTPPGWNSGSGPRVVCTTVLLWLGPSLFTLLDTIL